MVERGANRHAWVGAFSERRRKEGKTQRWESAVGPQNRGGKGGEIERRDKSQPASAGPRQGPPVALRETRIRAFVHSPSEVARRFATDYRALIKHGVTRDG